MASKLKAQKFSLWNFGGLWFVSPERGVRGSAANFAGLQKKRWWRIEAGARSRGQESRCGDVKCDQRRPGAGPVSSHSGAGWHQSIVPLLSALSIYIFSVNRAIFTICYCDEEAFKWKNVWRQNCMQYTAKKCCWIIFYFPISCRL